MKALDILLACRGRAIDARDLRAFSAALGVELARGSVDMAPVLEELVWLEAEGGEHAYVGGLKDLAAAFVASQSIEASTQPAASRVPDDLAWELLELMADRGDALSASELAELQSTTGERRRHPVTIHRRLHKLAELGLVKHEPDASDHKRVPFALTDQAVTALAARSVRARRGTAAREELAWCVGRHVDKLDMRPYQRTLYWALLHWAGALLERESWTAREEAHASGLRRILVALGQPHAAGTLDFTGAGDAADLLDILWRYCDLRELKNDDLGLEQELLSVAPAVEHPGAIAWAIAATRVTHALHEQAARATDASRKAEVTDLEKRFKEAATRVLAARTEPLAIFWRSLSKDIDTELGAAPLDVSENNPVTHALEQSRRHLRVAALCNHYWEPVQRELAKMWTRIWDDLGSGELVDNELTKAWIEKHRSTLIKAIAADMAKHHQLELMITRYVTRYDDKVPLGNLARTLPTVQADPNLTGYDRLCSELLKLAPTPGQRKAQKRAALAAAWSSHDGAVSTSTKGPVEGNLERLESHSGFTEKALGLA